jgi:hypothetical protein
MSKAATTQFESEVKNCPAYGKFAVELLERVAQDQKLNFETLWAQYFTNLSHVKALKNARHFIKQCDPRNTVAPAKSDYHFYLTEQSKSIQAKGETYDIANHGKEIGKRWKALSDTERATYQTLATADRERRQTELDAIEERIKTGALQDSPFRRSPRHRTGNVSALNMYVREMTQKIRESDPTLPNTQRMQRIHVQWKQLTTEEHARYQALADETNKANAESKAAASAAVVPVPTEVVEVAPKAKAAPKAAPKAAKVAAPKVEVAAAAAPAPAPAAAKAAKGTKSPKVEATPAPVAAPVVEAPKAKAAKKEVAAPAKAAVVEAKVVKATKAPKAK